MGWRQIFLVDLKVNQAIKRLWKFNFRWINAEFSEYHPRVHLFGHCFISMLDLAYQLNACPCQGGPLALLSTSAVAAVSSVSASVLYATVFSSWGFMITLDCHILSVCILRKLFEFKHNFSIWAYLVSMSVKTLLAKAIGLPVCRSAGPNSVSEESHCKVSSHWGSL